MPNKTRPQKLATNAAHLEKLDRLNIRPYKAEGEKIRAAAAAAGQSVTAYILDAVRARMEQEERERPKPDKGGEEGGL